MARRGSSNGSWLIPFILLYTESVSMGLGTTLSRILLGAAIAGLIFPVDGADNQADDSNGAAYRARGKDFLASGEHEKAGADLERAVQLAPADGQAYAARAEYFAAVGKPVRAIQDYTA